MTFDLQVDAARWRSHLAEVAEATRGLVPVVKGNGYGLGRGRLAAEATALGCPMLAVGTYAEVPDALAAFSGDVMVLSPWRPFLSDVTYDDRVVHTVGRVADVEALAGRDEQVRVVVEGETSMARHGFDRHELAAAAATLGDLRVEGFAVHLPLPGGGAGRRAADGYGGNLVEAESWAAALAASPIETDTLFLSHLTDAEVVELGERRPGLTIRPRIGTSLWLGDLGAFDVRSTVLDVHRVSRGERVGYRQRPVPRDGYLLVLAGGTSHGLGLEAPRAQGSVVQRGKTLAKGGLEAAGYTLSPFHVDGKQRWFAEPPHMQASLVFLPASARAPEVGDTVPAAVRYTITTFDTITLA